MKPLKFYDVRNRKSFTSSNYKIVKKKGKRFAVAINPKTKGDCWRILGNA